MILVGYSQKCGKWLLQGEREMGKNEFENSRESLTFRALIQETQPPDLTTTTTTPPTNNHYLTATNLLIDLPHHHNDAYRDLSSIESPSTVLVPRSRDVGIFVCICAN